MATPPRVSENQTTQQNYVAQLTIAAALSQAVRHLWLSVNPLTSARSLEAFGAGAHVLVDQYAGVAVSTASDHYLTARLEAGVKAPVRLPVMSPPPAAKVDKELDWIERQRVEIEKSVAADVAEIEAKLLTEMDAAFQKVIVDEARQFTVEAVEGDEKALGFRRVARPTACAWCLALAIRTTTRRGRAKDFKRYGTPGSMGGDQHWGVYKSREAAGQLPPGSTSEVNRYHFNCHCTVEPIFDASFVPAEWLVEVDALYAESDNFNDFRRRLDARRRGDASPDPTPVLPVTANSAAQRAQVAAIADLLSRLAA